MELSFSTGHCEKVQIDRAQDFVEFVLDEYLTIAKLQLYVSASLILAYPFHRCENRIAADCALRNHNLLVTCYQAYVANNYVVSSAIARVMQILHYRGLRLGQ